VLIPMMVSTKIDKNFSLHRNQVVGSNTREYRNFSKNSLGQLLVPDSTMRYKSNSVVGNRCGDDLNELEAQHHRYSTRNLDFDTNFDAKRAHNLCEY